MSDNKELETKPFLLRDGEVRNSDEFLLKIFKRINPRLREKIEELSITGDIFKIIRIYKNKHPDEILRYNTIAEITTDGCYFSNQDGDKATLMMSYGRWDASLMEFKETKTVGVPDVPLVVESNTKEGVNKSFYNLLDDVILVKDTVDGFPGVKLWKGIVKRDNRACIYTRWKKQERIYYEDFEIYAKAYTPDRGFEASDFVE